jgi:FkbM family methyltransferase
MPEPKASLPVRIRAHIDDLLAKAVKHRLPSLTSPNDFIFDGLKKRDHPIFVQCGANGVTRDVLQDRVVRSGIRTILIEPHPYYIEVLTSRYRDFPNVEIINKAADARPGTKTLYYIDPQIADEMDGSGPANKWAHGQGTFQKETIVYWITSNTWRWRAADLTQKYISAIRETTVECATLDSMLRSRAASHCAALVIDVQGAEFSVLRGMRSVRPSVIQYEDDRGFDVESFWLLKMRGYRCVHSGSDVIFEAGADR